MEELLAKLAAATEENRESIEDALLDLFLEHEAGTVDRP